MTKTIHWLSIAAIASVLLLVPIASTPVAFTDDESVTEQCVADCIDAYDDAMEVCDDVPPEEFASCAGAAFFALQFCLFGDFDVLPFSAPPPETGCLGGIGGNNEA